MVDDSEQTRQHTTRSLLMLIFAVVLIASSGLSSVWLMFGWRAGQHAADVRLDVVGRERNLVTWVLAGTERVLGEGDRTNVDELATHLLLLRQSWVAAGNGGPELGLDLQPTGRTLRAWPDLNERFGTVGAAMLAYADHVHALVYDGLDHRSDSPELRATAERVVVGLNGVVSGASADALQDNRFLWSAMLMIIAVAGVVGAIVTFVSRGRRRTLVSEARTGALLASEARYRALMMDLPVPVLIQGDRGILAANDAAAALIGSPSPDDLIGVDFRKFLVPGTEVPVTPLGSVTASDAPVVEFRVTLDVASGLRTLQMHRRVINLDGEPVALLVADDVTSQIVSAAELAAAAELHRFLAENASERLMRASVDGTILYSSQAAGSTLELDAGDLVGANILEITHEDDRAALQEAIAQATASATAVEADARIATRVAPRYAWVSISVQCVVDAGGARELHLSMRDITRRHAADVALAEAESMQRLILESLNEGVVFSDSGLGVIRANRSAMEMLGVVEGAGPIMSQLDPGIELFEVDGTPVSFDETPSQRVSRTGRTERGRLIELRNSNGSSRWLQIDTNLVKNTAVDSDGEHLVLSTFIDVTATRQAELALTTSESIQRQILDSLDEGVVLHGMDVGVISANRSATERLGIVASSEPFPVQLIRHVQSFEADGSLLDLDDTPTLRATRSGRPDKGRILRYQRNDGSSRWMQIDAYPLVTQTGGSTAPVLMTFVDITAEHEAAIQLAVSEQRLRLVIENSRELICVVDLTGILTFVSPSALDILGHSPADVTGTDIRNFIHPDDYAGVIKQVMGRTARQSVGVRVRHADGSTRWVETLARIMTDADGAPTSVLLSSRDITRRLEAERQLESERRLIQATFRSIHAGVLAVDGTGRIIEANKAFCSLIGATVEAGDDGLDFARHCTLTRADGQELEMLDNPLTAALMGESRVDVPLRLVRTDTIPFEILASASPISAVGEGGDGAVLTIHDVSALRAAEADLRRLATIDVLTGLPNRRALVAHLDQVLSHRRRNPGSLSVLFLDLDGFKAINDRLGHEAGDELLAATAGRISSVLRPSDMVARYGGDEFVVVIEHVERGDNVRAIADRIEFALSQPFCLSRGTAEIGCSVGVGRIAANATPDTVLATADAAMYESKRRKLTTRQS